MSEVQEGQLNVNMATCRCCGNLVEKIEYRGKFYNLRRQRWNGRMCPTCNVAFTRSNMKNLRSTRLHDVNDEWSSYDKKEEV